MTPRPAALRIGLCAPPYPLLPVAVYALVVLCFILHPQSAVRHFVLADPDDWMRLSQVANWLSGQGWHDLSQARLSPDDHTIVNWSRLVDLPLAGIALALSPWLGLKQGLMAAALIVPPALLGVLIFAVVTMARPFVSRRKAAWASVMLLFAPVLLFNVTPGRVDHHAYQLIVAALGFACLTRMMLAPRGWRIALLAALNFACGLWIGGEALPALIFFSGSLAIAAAWRGGPLLRQAAWFGVALFAFTALALPLARPVAEWGAMEITWFSTAYVIFTAFLGGALVGLWLLARRCVGRWARLALLATCGGVAALGFFFCVPEALQGPYANFDPLSAPMVLDNVGEAQPLFPSLRPTAWFSVGTANKALLFGRVLLLPLLALLVVLAHCWRARGRRRMAWLAAGAFLLPFMLLTLFWQTRCIAFMQHFSLMPLTWLLLALWRRIAETMAGRCRFWAEILAFGALGLLPVVLLPAIVAGKPVYPDMLLFPGARPLSACDPTKVFVTLRDPAGLGDRPRLIRNMMNDGPALLFATPHSVLSAPYNAKGNRDSLAFFSARDEASAQSVLRRRQVDLVLLCRNISPLYAGLTGPRRLMPTLVKGKDGALDIVSDEDRPTMAERLARSDPPPWLKRVVLLDDKDYLLYSVVQDGMSPPD